MLNEQESFQNSILKKFKLFFKKSPSLLLVPNL
jgi:hypothetical protein